MMSTKARWLAALRLQPVDRLPFWPKLDGAYPQAQTFPFRAMTCAELHAWMGSDPHDWVGPALRETRPHTAVEQTRDGQFQRTVYRTPHGTLESVQQFDAASCSWHPIVFPIKRQEDIQAMTAWYADAQLAVDAEALAQAQARYREIGDAALVGVGIGESPLMYFVEWLAGVENAHLFLADYPAEVEELFDAIHRSLLRRTELLVAHNPADVCYMVENTSTTLISPQQYRAYCLPYLQAYAQIAQAHARLMILHMCGHLKALLPELATLPVAGFEAFTSPTLGNTTLLDGRTACPQTCLIGGTNAMLWLRPAEEITAQIAADLAVLPHHRGLVITSAGVMPPRCAPETIRAVCQWVREYPARLEEYVS